MEARSWHCSSGPAVTSLDGKLNEAEGSLHEAVGWSLRRTGLEESRDRVSDKKESRAAGLSTGHRLSRTRWFKLGDSLLSLKKSLRLRGVRAE